MFKSAVLGILAACLLVKIATAVPDVGRWLVCAVSQPSPADAGQAPQPSRALAIKLVV